MFEITDDCCALESDDLVRLHEPEPEPAEREPWLLLYFDRRRDAFEAAKAADLLGVSWRLATQRCEIGEFDDQQWAVEIFLDSSLPDAASALITRNVA